MITTRLYDEKSSTAVITAVTHAATATTSTAVSMLPVTVTTVSGQSGILIEVPESNQKQTLNASSLDAWREEMRSLITDAIEEWDEGRLSILLGPDIYSAQSVYHEKNLFKKYQQNTSQFIESFYQYATHLVSVIQQRLKTESVLSLYEKETIPFRQAEVTKFHQAKQRGERNAARTPHFDMIRAQLERKLDALLIKNPKDAEDASEIQSLKKQIKNLKSENSFTPGLLVKLTEDKFAMAAKGTQTSIDEFKSIKEEYHALIKSSEAKDIVTAWTGLYEKMKPSFDQLEAAAEIRDKISLTLKPVKFANTSPLYHHVKTSLEAANQRCIEGLMQNLADDIETIRKQKELTNDGIKRRFTEPLSQVYKAKLNDLTGFFESLLAKCASYEDLEKLPALLQKQKQDIQAKLNLLQSNTEQSKHQETNKTSLKNTDHKETAKPLGLEEEKTLITETYRKKAIEWLNEKGNIKLFKRDIGDPVAFVDKIIQNGIGATRLDVIRDKEGNTLMHAAMHAYHEAQKQMVKRGCKDPQLEPAFHRILANLEARGASVFTANNNHQTANEYAMDMPGTGDHKPNERMTQQINGRFIETRREISAKDTAYHKFITWPSMTEIIESIRTYTPLAREIKAKIHAYSQSNGKKIKEWTLWDSLIFSRVIVEQDRLNEVATIAKFLQMAGRLSSDLLVADAIRQLNAQARCGISQGSTLFTELLKILENPDLIGLKFTVEQLKELEIQDQFEKGDAKTAAAEAKAERAMAEARDAKAIADQFKADRDYLLQAVGALLRSQIEPNNPQITAQLKRLSIFSSSLTITMIDSGTISANTNNAGSTATTASQTPAVGTPLT
ncbi:hypothetical protein AYO45_02120 [Gammaproteobacteria bacterium SCGC AG-212-F23]|nr:hypothetical protein AYO45_02120 [Gammaproteobacteria bacterium SCGC AG-212-F23]